MWNDWGSTESDFVIRSLRRTKWFLQRGYIYIYVYMCRGRTPNKVNKMCTHRRNLKLPHFTTCRWQKCFPYRFLLMKHLPYVSLCHVMKPLLRFKVHDVSKKLGADHSWPFGRRKRGRFSSHLSWPTSWWFNNKSTVDVFGQVRKGP